MVSLWIEAMCATESEVLVTWKGMRPLVLVGDPEQLSASVFSEYYKTLGGSIANWFARQ